MKSARELFEHHSPPDPNSDGWVPKLFAIKMMEEYAQIRARERVLEYAKWYEQNGPPESQQEDWMVEQNVKSFFDPRL